MPELSRVKKQPNTNKKIFLICLYLIRISFCILHFIRHLWLLLLYKNNSIKTSLRLADEVSLFDGIRIYKFIFIIYKNSF